MWIWIGSLPIRQQNSFGTWRSRVMKRYRCIISRTCIAAVGRTLSRLIERSKEGKYRRQIIGLNRSRAIDRHAETHVAEKSALQTLDRSSNSEAVLSSR